MTKMYNTPSRGTTHIKKYVYIIQFRVFNSTHSSNEFFHMFTANNTHVLCDMYIICNHHFKD